MDVCQNQVAAHFALPEEPMPVRNRRMTLQLQCSDRADYSANLMGLGRGKTRAGAPSRTFLLCENHAQLFPQIDQELFEDGWARSCPSKPQRI